MALHWAPRSRHSTVELLLGLGAKSRKGRNFDREGVTLAHTELQRAGLLVVRGHSDHARLRDDARAALYRELLADTPAASLFAALGRSGEARPGIPDHALWNQDSATGLLRLELLTGAGPSRLEDLKARLSRADGWEYVLGAALFEAFDAELFERICPEWRFDLAASGLARFCDEWRPDLVPLRNWARRLSPNELEKAAMLRLELAEVLLFEGDAAGALKVLAGVPLIPAFALRAATKVQQGRWAEGQAEFEAAFKGLQTRLGRRKQLMPDRITWLYPLALLAQQTPRTLELARKFCATESGSRDPYPTDPWGGWVHAVRVRTGDATLDREAFELHPHYGYRAHWANLWRSLLRAWLGREVIGPQTRSAPARAKAVASLSERLSACGFTWLMSQLAAAESVFEGGDPKELFFVPARAENWRSLLVSLQALGDEKVAEGGARGTRLLWVVCVDKEGGLEDITPMEQKRGPRGWSRGKPVPLSRVAKDQKLDPWDAKVARAIQGDRYGPGTQVLDLAAAIVALVGHPGVVLNDAPDTLVDVVEGTPELEVSRTAKGFLVRVNPPLREDREAEVSYYMDNSVRREREALRSITVLRDSPQRIRVIRFTDAQRRAAKLLSGDASLPAQAEPELQQALRSLAGHFHVQSDHVEAAVEVAAASRLRAELAPAGDGVRLRLVAAPLGPDGPRLMPGRGRARVMASINGETRGAERDLAAERAHLDAVLQAFEFLDAPAPGDLGCDWVIEEPDQALAVIEALPQQPGIEALDWPRGQAVRVLTASATHLKVRVRSERDWFKIDGRALLDEGTVLELEALLKAASGRSRFVPMGKGVYVALTRELREKLVELGAVTEADGDALRAPHLAAAWLDDLLVGVDSDIDPEFAGRLERLRAAQDQEPARPALQGELRPYQQDGYAWAMRLAQAGFGACLADDMGLGKTIQALGVLLERGVKGPALVVAPTSVCGNWAAEIRRFTPTLNPTVYGDGDRAAVVRSAGPLDVVIVSYTLMLQAQETFASRAWHTLVADEAQIIKNSAAKRSAALFDLKADFRLALSGTPIENRLGDLWSIMRFCNPGMLGSLSRFTERFATPIERDRDREAQRLLRRLISPFVLRRTKAEVLQELPPRTELVLTIQPEPAEAAHYEALRRVAVREAQEAAATEPGRAGFRILAELTKLRRAACDPRLPSPELGITGAKVRAFAELAAELIANGHKALVFSQFVDFLTLLREPLDRAGVPYQYLDGATPAAERTKRVAAFQKGEGDLFLISLKAGGFGLNLTAADYVVITDPWWNPAAEDQATGRAHRMGQARPVTVYRLVTRGTLEERIVKLHDDKRALAEGVLAEGSEGKAIPSAEELIDLMRL
jgi:superfamily II DNA or RNA helicase